ncbi:MAG: hypothetical protein QNJ09_00595 [Paracoccaceae bacterium]|nr:hypothetical protein [Paracoccaceae bacterium]
MAGVIPPIRPSVRGHDPDRSPYAVSFLETIQRFAFSDERARILSGLLDYRTALYRSGIVAGFQWLDGSFLENIEDLESRPPNDIDVVTFFELPPGHTQVSLLTAHGALFDPTETKRNFSVDAYPFVLNQPMTERMVRQTSYWYSMWSHRRNGVWKGFVQVDLNPSTDASSRTMLDQMITDGFV